ncbi:SHOCT domain-containing protein [Flavobacterium psychrotrophum]|uniref:SHOCT domain-containing protein n=1 Tax=Flavobacterium psychrotrophum TaxID=2294119 RepID=UPI000E319B1A|nr:SHOCT domain-containing protein [Flavobacterium psychrotrophum]
MDKIEKLKQLKQLLDDSVINSDEYNAMKQEIIAGNATYTLPETSSSPERTSPVMNKKGDIRLVFAGCKGFFFDVKTKIFINGTLLSAESTKRGFDLIAPISGRELSIRLVLGGMKSTTYEITEIEPNKDYTMTFSYDLTWGKYSNNFNLS